MNTSEDCDPKTNSNESSSTACCICESVCGLICKFFGTIGNILETVFNFVNAVVIFINTFIKCKSDVYTRKMQLKTARKLAEIKSELEVDDVLNETFGEIRKSQNKSGWFGKFLGVFQISRPDEIEMAKMSDEMSNDTNSVVQSEQLNEKEIKNVPLDKPYFNAGVENE